MRILGIDPGLQVTGFGVIELQGRDLHYIASGCIRTQAKTALAARLKTLLTGLTEVLDTYQPEQVAIEKVFVNVNPQSTLLLGQARGVAIAAVVLQDILPSEYTALQVKQAVVGHGHAAKEQVQDMVVRLLALGGTPQSDAADALACAICHSHYTGNGFAQYVQQGYRIRQGRLV